MEAGCPAYEIVLITDMISMHGSRMESLISTIRIFGMQELGDGFDHRYPSRKFQFEDGSLNG